MKHNARTIAALFLAAGLLLTACGGDATPDAPAAESPAAASEAAEPDPDPVPSEDESEPAAAEDATGPFRMEVRDAFKISGRDEPLVTGTIDAGTVRVGDGLCLDGTAVTVEALEVFDDIVDSAAAGENIGALLGGVALEEIQVGMVLQAC